MAAPELGFSRKGGRERESRATTLVQAKREARKETQSVLLRLHRGSSPSSAATGSIAPLGGGGAGNGEAARAPTAWGFEPFWGDGRTAYCGGINEPPSSSS